MYLFGVNSIYIYTLFLKLSLSPAMGIFSHALIICNKKYRENVYLERTVETYMTDKRLYYPNRLHVATVATDGTKPGTTLYNTVFAIEIKVRDDTNAM